MDISSTETQWLLIGGAIWAFSSLGLGKVWSVFEERGQGLKLAKRGLYWIIQWLAKQGVSADDAAGMTLQEIIHRIGTREFKFPEK